MGSNPLLRSLKASEFQSSLSARDWYDLAVAKGHKEAAAAWYRRAVELGEINGDGRYRASGD